MEGQAKASQDLFLWLGRGLRKELIRGGFELGRKIPSE
jgi:hypothetical protein